MDAELVDEALSVAAQRGQEFADAYIFSSACEAGADGIATFNWGHFEKFDMPLYRENLGRVTMK